MARVRFRIDRTGKVAATEIHTSSGNPSIDTLALEAVPIGSELTPIPADFGMSGIVITVPLRFPSRYH